MGAHDSPPAGGGEPEALAPGTVFGKYEIVRCIGAGGMGCVYEATHALLRKRVALKTLHPRLTAQFDFRARFLREGETLARIRHPNVVDISDVGVHDGLTYLVMEFLEGESLHALLSRERFLDGRRLANLMLPLIDGLGAAHAAGVVHRDIKPENIFLAKDAKGEVRPKLLDFGISKVAGTPPSMALTSGGAVMGTPFYMSPEQTRGAADVDWRADQYALGVVLYECATGKLPFQQAVLFDQMNAIVAGIYEHPCAVRPELSADIAEVIIRAMALDPARRFDPLDALGRALLPFAGSRARAYYETVFSADGPLPDSVRPPPPTFDPPSGVIELPPDADTPRLVMPTGTIDVRISEPPGAISVATPLPPSVPTLPIARPRRRRRTLVLGVLGFVALGAAAYIMWHGGNRAAATAPQNASERRATPGPAAGTVRPAQQATTIVEHTVATPPMAPAPIPPAAAAHTGSAPAAAEPARVRQRRGRTGGAAATTGTSARTPPAGGSLDIRLTR